MRQIKKPGHARISLLPLARLKHPPENDVVYRPIDPADPEVRALARSIAKHGIKEPLIVSLDDYILSGNRRAVASGIAELRVVPCIVEPIPLTPRSQPP